MKKLYFLFLLHLFVLQACSQDHSATTTSDLADPRGLLEQFEPKVHFDKQPVYRSVDQGETWEAFGAGLPDEAIVSSFLSDQEHVYLTTDYHGIYFYNEKKKSWEDISSNLTVGLDINAIATTTTTTTTSALVIGTFRRGIFISKNGGKSWEAATKSPEDTPIRALYTFQNKLIAGTDKGVYESTDHGMTWQHRYGDMQINGFTIMNQNIYAAASNGGLMSKDGGRSWQYIYTDLTLHDISNDGQYLYAMTLGDGLLRTDDDGKSWAPINLGLDPEYYYTFEVKTIGKKLFAAQHYGIYQSLDYGKSWKKLRTKIPKNYAFLMLENTPLGLLTGLKERKLSQHQ